MKLYFGPRFSNDICLTYVRIISDAVEFIDAVSAHIKVVISCCPTGKLVVVFQF